MANYSVENQWGGPTAPWNPGGTWVLGNRTEQHVVALDIKTADNGKTYTGTMQYSGEGPIGFKATKIDGFKYAVENQWGGPTAPWNPGGTWVIGNRADQYVVFVKVTAESDSTTLFNSLGMEYSGEGPIGFKGTLA